MPTRYMKGISEWHLRRRQRGARIGKEGAGDSIGMRGIEGRAGFKILT